MPGMSRHVPCVAGSGEESGEPCSESSFPPPHLSHGSEKKEEGGGATERFPEERDTRKIQNSCSIGT